MIPTKDYNKPIKVGDLIWYQKDSSEAYGGEDLGYVSEIFVLKGLKKLKVIWFKAQDKITYSEETKQSIKEMKFSYILPVL
jgi:hypothetical protein